MRLFNKNILLALALLAAAQGCDKEPVPPQDTGAPIMLSAAESGTKALLDNDLFNTDGNRIQVYDFVNDGTTTSKHIDAYAGPDVDSSSPLHVEGTTWPFTDEINGTEADVYQWTPGVHNFFGWLAKDANMASNNTPESFFGNGFSFEEETKVLTIPTKAINVTTPQFDFLYSDITSSEPINNYVQMSFKHLFTAISFGIKNSGASSVTIDEIKIEKLYSSKSAEVKFTTSGTSGAVDPIVTYIDGYQSSTPYMSFQPNLTLASNTHTNFIYSGNSWNTTSAVDVNTDISEERKYYIMWPQDANDVFSTEEITYSGTGNNLTPNYPTTWKIYLKYTDNKETKIIRLNFPNASWQAGKKYHFDIAFASKVRIDYDVVDWTDVNNSITFN